MSEQLIRKPCPRCGTTQCFGVDDKSCSDFCITRHQQENATLRAELAQVTERARQLAFDNNLLNQTNEFLAQQLAEATTERDTLDKLTSMQSGSFTMLHQQIAERDAQITYLQAVSTQQVEKIRALEHDLEEWSG